MNLFTALILILSSLIAIQVMFEDGHSQAVEGAIIKVPEPEMQLMFTSDNNIQTPDPDPEEPPTPENQYPEPEYVPSLRQYQINKDHDIWHASDPSSYITPDNEWVKFYASKLYIDQDGSLRYKNRHVPLKVDMNGNVLQWTDEPFINSYITDDEQFNFPPNADVWVMPEYYLTHGMKDDCDGWMVTVTSMMQSGELSILEEMGMGNRSMGTSNIKNLSFVKKKIPSKAVLGYMMDSRDGWVEFKAYNKTFLTTTALVSDGSNKSISATEFIERKKKTISKPVFEIESNNFGYYKAW